MPVANLYINYSDDNVAIKNLSIIEEDVPIRYKDPCNIETPVISFDRLKEMVNEGYNIIKASYFEQMNMIEVTFDVPYKSKTR